MDEEMEHVKRTARAKCVSLPRSFTPLFNPGTNTLTIATGFGRGIMPESLADIEMESRKTGILQTLRTEADRGVFLIWNE